MQTRQPYFTETQHLIHKRLLRTTRILWIAAVAVFVISLMRAISLYMSSETFYNDRFLHQILNSLVFAPYIPVMMYAERIAQLRPRLSTQFTLIATFSMLSAQLILNGADALHAMFALPVLMALAGFFTNTQISRLIAVATAGLVIMLTVFELMGIQASNPDSTGYFSIRNCIYIFLVLFTAYVLIEIIVHDFFIIQEGLIHQRQEAERIAAQDTLTGLHNRYYSEQTFAEFFSKAKPSEKGFIIFLDIDNFKMLNTRFGHQGGDKALQIIAERLGTVTRHYQAVACRIGGDEFIVLLIIQPDQVQKVTQSMLDKVSEPFVLFDETLQITCSIGIAKIDKNSNFSDVYRQANTAMNRAKYAGKNTQIEHLQAYSDEEMARAKILSHLQQALDRDEFKVHYQPQVDMGSGAIIGMEALIRWELEGKELLPGRFIELAEQYGLIHSISAWVIRQACKDCKRLHDSGYKHLFVAVNISAVLLERNNLVETVASSLLETGLSPSALELELTESALFQQGRTSGYEQLQQIRQMGVELSIDDFGTGYSNLHYLGQLDIQRLKIDRSFVMQLQDTVKAIDLVAAIIDIAKRFHLKTVAEGIETMEVANILREMHCDVGQGYYWSKAVPIDSLLNLLNSMPDLSRKSLCSSSAF